MEEYLIRDEEEQEPVIVEDELLLGRISFDEWLSELRLNWKVNWFSSEENRTSLQLCLWKLRFPEVFALNASKPRMANIRG